MKIRIDKEFDIHNMELTVGVDSTVQRLGELFDIDKNEAALWLSRELENTPIALVSIDGEPFIVFVLNNDEKNYSLYPRPILSVLLYGLEISDHNPKIFGAGVDINEDDIEFLEEEAWRMLTCFMLDVFEELDGYVVKPL